MARVLVVDDNLGDRALIESMLRQSDPAIKVETCGDGEQALARLRPGPSRGHFDLVLLDWNVPRFNGREVLQELARHPSFRRQPIVVLSSSDAPSDVDAAYDLGAFGYVVKPIGYQEYAERLRAILAYWLGAVRRPSAAT